MGLLDVIASDTADIIGGDFSEPVSLVYDEGTGSAEVTAETRGIFDSTFEEINPDTGIPVMSNSSRVTLYETEIEEATGRQVVEDEAEYWRVIVRNTTYRPRAVQRDGTGLVTIILRKYESS